VLFLQESILIPESRIAVLIGKSGKTKREIESKTKTRIEIDSEEGEVLVEGKEKNAISFYNAINIIKAIARGFSPENAFLLLEDEILLEIMKISDYIGDNDSLLKAKRGRIIGTEGRSREKLENKTRTKISVQGKTIAIIGKGNSIEKAKTAIEMLLGGAKHGTAFSLMDRKQVKKFEI